MALETFYNSFTPDALYIYDTVPTNIQLVNLNRASSLIDSSYYGINGGWYNLVTTGLSNEQKKSLLNFAYNKGKPIGTSTFIGGNGIVQNGSANDVGDFAIAYNGATKKLSYKTARDITAVPNYNHSGTWVQGGIAMSLGNSNWGSLLHNNQVSTSYSAARFTAMVADTVYNKVYLIVTYNPNGERTIKYSDLRNAIQERFAITDGSSDNARYKGIFLDGSDSSQMKVLNKYGNEVRLNSAGNRQLMQIVALIDKNK